VAKLTSLTEKIAVQLHLVTESCTICSSCSMRPVQKRLETPSYTYFTNMFFECLHTLLALMFIYWGHKLTPWSKVLLQKLIVTQLVKQFPAFHGTRRLIAIHVEVFRVMSVCSGVVGYKRSGGSSCT